MDQLAGHGGSLPPEVQAQRLLDAAGRGNGLLKEAHIETKKFFASKRAEAATANPPTPPPALEREKVINLLELYYKEAKNKKGDGGGGDGSGGGGGSHKGKKSSGAGNGPDATANGAFGKGKGKGRGRGKGKGKGADGSGGSAAVGGGTSYRGRGAGNGGNWQRGGGGGAANSPNTTLVCYLCKGPHKLQVHNSDEIDAWIKGTPEGGKWSKSFQGKLYKQWVPKGNNSANAAAASGTATPSSVSSASTNKDDLADFLDEFSRRLRTSSGI